MSVFSTVLTETELLHAAQIGVRRQIAAICLNYKHRNPPKDEGFGFGNHILGAMAEFCVAKKTGLPWHASVGEVNNPDVGSFIEVRARRADATGRDLGIRPEDHDCRPYVLVHCLVPKFRLVGWIYGSEGKTGLGVWNEKQRVWYVSPDKLRPIETLVDEPQEKRAA